MKGLLASFVCWPLCLPAATLRVPAEFPTIQSALDAARDGDTVLAAPGEYVIAEPIDFNRLRDPQHPASPPAKNLVLRSEEGADRTVILGSGAVFRNGEDERSVFEGF